MKLSIRKEAEEDIDQAFGWHSANVPHVANRFLNALENLFVLVMEHPALFPIVYRDLRRAMVRHFPFSLYYRINGADVTAFAVLHQHSADETWQTR